MTLISIRLPETVLNEADQHAKSLRVHRAEYICRAIEHWNKETHHRPHHHRYHKRQIIRPNIHTREDKLPTVAESGLTSAE